VSTSPGRSASSPAVSVDDSFWLGAGTEASLLVRVCTAGESMPRSPARTSISGVAGMPGAAAVSDPSGVPDVAGVSGASGESGSAAMTGPADAVPSAGCVAAGPAGSLNV